MKLFPIFLSAFMMLVSCFAYAQEYDKMSVDKLNRLKDEAAKNEKYKEAHKFKLLIELKKDLEKALASEDYLKASELKEKMAAVVNGESTSTGTSSTSKDSYNLDYFNTIYLYNKDENSSHKLEKQVAEMRTSSYSAIWVAGSSSFWEVDGMYSNVELNNKNKYTFLVKVQKGVDPATLFKLNRLEVLNDKENNFRRSLLSFKTTAAAYAGASTKQNDESEVKISYKKVTDEIFEIIIDEVIPPGQYAFSQNNTWFLFSARNQFTNSDELSVSEREFTDGYFYDEREEFPRSVWLGFDYSLLRLRSDDIQADHQTVEDVIKKAVDRNNFKEVFRQKEIDSYFRREKRIIWNPIYMYEFMEDNAPESYIITESQEYQVTDKMIEAQVKKYKVSYPHLGIVMFPEVIDMVNKEARGRIVWFDFDTRKVVLSISTTMKPNTDERLKERSVWADIFNLTNRCIRGEYLDKWAAYN